MARSRPTFDLPTGDDLRRLDGVNRDWYYSHRETPGATYRLERSEQTHRGDPQQIALREPEQYQHPQRLGPDTLDPGGPRIWPTSGAVTHGPQQGREEAFGHGEDDADDGYYGYEDDYDGYDNEQARRQGAAHLHRFFTEDQLGFRDRRQEGRRYRPTDLMKDLDGPQPPYRPAPAPADLPLSRFQSSDPVRSYRDV